MITVPLLQIRKQTHGVFVASSYVEYVGSWIDGFVHLHQALSQVLGTQRQVRLDPGLPDTPGLMQAGGPGRSADHPHVAWCACQVGAWRVSWKRRPEAALDPHADHLLSLKGAGTVLGMGHTARGTSGAHGPPWGQNHLEGAMGSSRLHVAPSTSVAPSALCQLRSGVWIPARQAARLS